MISEGDNLELCLCGAPAEIAQTRHKAQHRYWGRCTKKRCRKQPECFEVMSRTQAANDWNDSIRYEQQSTRA